MSEKIINMSEKTIYETDEWMDFLSEGIEVRNFIIQYLTKHQGVTFEELYKKTSYLRHCLHFYMKLWEEHYCTFYSKYGRIIEINDEYDNGHWYHLPTNHPLSRLPQRQLKDKLKECVVC